MLVKNRYLELDDFKNIQLKFDYVICEWPLVKRRLYRSMRSKNSSNWVILLPKIVDAINSTPNQGIGNLVPRQVQGTNGDLIIRGKNHSKFE